MNFEPSQIIQSAQVWVCEACGTQDHKSCSCNSPARMEMLAAAREAERQRGRARREKDKEKQSSRPADASVENIKETAVDIEVDGEPDETNIGLPIARRRGFIWRASEAVRYARFDDLADLKIDEEMRKAAAEAVKAWSEILSRLEAKHGKDKAA